MLQSSPEKKRGSFAILHKHSPIATMRYVSPFFFVVLPFNTCLCILSNTRSKLSLHSVLNNIDAASSSAKETSVREKVETQFKKTMLNESVPLLQNFDTYARHLPVRKVMVYDPDLESATPLKLHELSFYVRPEDLQRMATAIERSMQSTRGIVNYITSPCGTGKTASVLPAFLESKRATHYLYIPLDNNGGKYFKAHPYEIGTTDTTIAECQGAAFMVQCVKNLLEGRPYGDVMVIDEQEAKAFIANAIEIEKSVIEAHTDHLHAYLNTTLSPRAVVWFHIDEHRKLIERNYDDPKEVKAAAAFAKGAMRVLASSPHHVIATYIRPVTELPSLSQEPSAVCRYPIALPPIDVDQVMRYDPDLNIGASRFPSKKQQQMLATLRLRLGIKISELGLLHVLHRKGSSEKVHTFLANFRNIVKTFDSSTSPMRQHGKLKALNSLCRTVNWNTKLYDKAAKLLLGVNERDESSQWIFEERLEHGIIAAGPDNLITCKLRTLLELHDTRIVPYRTGRDLFRKVLEADTSNLLIGTPLEYAYFWTLACTSALNQFIDFGSDCFFQIKCESLVPGRIFKDNSMTLDNDFLNQMQENVIYYADEHKNDHDGTGNVTKWSHSVANLFFRTEAKELVLVDITDEAKSKVEDKVKEKRRWLNNTFIPDSKLVNSIRCIVVAPNVDGEVESEQLKNGSVHLTCGEKAVKLLGGLSQYLPWLFKDKQQSSE